MSDDNIFSRKSKFSQVNFSFILIEIQKLIFRVFSGTKQRDKACMQPKKPKPRVILKTSERTKKKKKLETIPWQRWWGWREQDRRRRQRSRPKRRHCSGFPRTRTCSSRAARWAKFPPPPARRRFRWSREPTTKPPPPGAS